MVYYKTLEANPNAEIFWEDYDNDKEEGRDPRVAL